MKSWNDRLALTRAGWRTEVRLTTSGMMNPPAGVVAFGVWAKTMYWKGWITDITLHDHDIIDLNEDDAIEKMARTVNRVREVCERAHEEYVDEIPCMGETVNGKIGLATHSWETKNAAERPRIHFPTENIPDGLETGSYDEEDGYLKLLSDAALAGLHIEDSINPYFGFSRYTSDCADRTWGYKVGVAKRKTTNDVKVSFKPRSLTVEALDEDSVCNLLSSAAASTQMLFARYAEGGDLAGLTANGLPPGHKTLAEATAEREANKTK